MVRLAVVVGMLVAATGAVAGGRQEGLASWYHLPGNRTASGAPYRASGHWCAHRTLRMGTRVRVTDRKTGRSIVCTIDDRGPFISGRVIDLNRGAAAALGMIERGVIAVSVVQVR